VPEAAGSVTAAFARTVPERIYTTLPRGEFSALQAHLHVLASAQRLVSIENQFLWSAEIVRVLAAKLRDPPHPDFRLVLLLPARPNNGADDTRGQLGVLAEADGGAGRLLACTIFARSDRARPSPVYVHAKVAVVDDRWLVVGSVNLNEHSLFNDGEAAVVVHDEALARETRLRLWAEHLDADRALVAGSPVHVVDEVLAPAAREGRARRDAGVAGGPRLASLPVRSWRAERLRGPLDALLVDG
jgi:phosphatidylserine/phosphatidylglycerophosphate/cardiolipin synthase-like enzyme